MAKILHIDQDLSASSAAKDWLKREGHNLEVAETAEDGLQLACNFDYDLILVEWALPERSGIQFCQDYRRAGGTSWVFVLSKLNLVDHVELALDAGADDFLSKPLDLRELSARVRRALRRAKTEIQPELEIDGALLNVAKRTLTVEEQTLFLSHKETSVLEYLMRHPNIFISSSKLLQAVWPSSSAVCGGTVRTFVRNLRVKLDAVGKPDFIRTVLGAGYIIEVPARKSGRLIESPASYELLESEGAGILPVSAMRINYNKLA